MSKGSSKHKNAEREFEKGLSLLEAGDILEAKRCFKDAHGSDPSDARCLSYYGYSIAFSGMNPQVGIELCNRALKIDDSYPEFYINLSRIYKKIKDRRSAMAVLKKGMAAISDNESLTNEYNLIGQRKTSAVPFLSRNNPVNIYLGRLKSFLIKM